MTARLCWTVIAVLESGQGIGTCGHEHEDREDALACSWTPDPWPYVCDLLVRQVRAWDGRAVRSRRKAQTVLDFGSEAAVV